MPARTVAADSSFSFAASISSDQLELYFTRFDQGEPAIYRSVRNHQQQPWSSPQRVRTVTGFVEAPALSPDGRGLYYHARRGSRFIIERVTRR